MNLFSKLRERELSGKPLRVGLIGAGKFGSMYLAQVPRVPGIHLAGIVDLSPANAQANLARVGWPKEKFSASSLDDAIKSGRTHVGDDWQALVAHPNIEIIIECTGNPPAAVEHALAAFRHGKHLINVTVEADAFCGPLLARKARDAGVIYSLAYGDQPGLACELVDWARTAGFPVVAAGRGHKWLPHYREVDAGHGVDALGTDRRAGEGRRAQSENVQRVPRRIEAGDRERGDRQRHRPRSAGSMA